MWGLFSLCPEELPCHLLWLLPGFLQFQRRDWGMNYGHPVFHALVRHGPGLGPRMMEAVSPGFLAYCKM